MRPPVVILLSGTLLACAATPPPSELVDAREVLRTARLSDARHQSPADLHEADEALKLAEARFADSPSADLTRATAYMAHRRALWAMSRVNEKKAHAERAAGEQELERMKQAEIAQQQQQQFVSPKEQLVITLSASVLFAPGKITLLAAAQQVLSDIARTVQDDPRHVVVLGRADAQGNTEASMKIAQARAEAVRAFLVSKGVPGGRVSARATGQPATDDGSTPGQANDPRLDIVLGDKPGAEADVAPP